MVNVLVVEDDKNLKKLMVTYLKRNNYEVSIKNNDIGMDSDELEMIYTRFYQIDKSHSGEGSGLGLAIVKGLLKFQMEK